NFSHADLTNSRISYANMSGANFTGADTRGSDAFYDYGVSPNQIDTNGHIHGLNLPAGDKLIVRNYHGDENYNQYSLPGLKIDDSASMAAGGLLQIVLDADAWESTISFEADSTVVLGGTLDLMFAADVSRTLQ